MLTWSDALAWAENFSFAGYADWRLPKGDPTCYGSGCIGSEMGHLWYVELGNSAGPITNSGSFFWSSNPAAGYYWSSTFAFGTEFQVFEMYLGGQGGRSYISTDLAMAVRDGDVPAIPEPGTYVLMLAGLAALALAMRRQQS